MALDSQEVMVALTGGIFRGDPGATLPTDASGALTGFNELGYVSEDGVSQTIDETTQKIRAWQNGDTVREVQTAHDLMFTFTCIESNETVLAAYYGNYAAGKVEINGTQGVRGTWVIQVKDGERDMRIVIPDGQITDRGDISYVNSAAVGYPITITCYPDSDYAGTEDAPAKAYIYLEEPATSS